MTIYITKEVDIELEEDEVLGEMDSADVLEHVVSNYDSDTLLGKLATAEIIEYLMQTDSLPRLLRKIAEALEQKGM